MKYKFETDDRLEANRIIASTDMAVALWRLQKVLMSEDVDIQVMNCIIADFDFDKLLE